jgi:formate hydrogenlyase subunit 3/multisubunit Na+/H+ antiporter MnhD subunit
MTALPRIVVGFLLLAHGLVHLLFLVPASADPKYPFTLQRSWLLPESARRPVAFVLMTVVIVGFLASALALWGVPVLAGAWSQITILAASSSIVLLIAFWDRQLWIGVLISALLIAAALRPTWIDTLLH